MKTVSEGEGAPLFTIEKVVAPSSPKTLSGCDLCEHCHLLHLLARSCLDRPAEGAGRPQGIAVVATGLRKKAV